MGLFLGSRERRSNAVTFAEPPIPPFPGADVYGRLNGPSSPDQALNVPTVWACVSLLANAVSMLPLETFRKTAGVPARITDPPLLTTPSVGMTQSEWLHMLMVSLLLRGNAFGQIVSRDSFQRPTQILLLNPDRIRITTDRDTGSTVYTYMSPGGEQRDISGSMWHVRGLTMPGMVVGLSPITYAAATIGIDISARTFAQDFYTGGGIPKAVLETDQAVDQTQARTIKERLLAATVSREPIILGAGLKYNMISVRPEESQFLATHQANVGQIARYFNVPAGMVGGNEGGSMTYSNTEQRSIDFLTYSVSFWLKRIEDAIFPLLSQPTYVKFDTKALLRTDAETAAKIAVQHIAAKVLTPSEVRNSLELPPMTLAQKAEADMVPLTVTPLGGAKALPGEKLPPGPVAPTPAADQQGDPANA